MPHPVRDILAASAAVDFCPRRHPAVRPDGCGFARRHGRIRRLAQRSSGCAPADQAARLADRRTRPRRRGISSEKCAAPRPKANRPKWLRSQPICLGPRRAAHHSRGAEWRRVRRRKQRGAHPRIAAGRQRRGATEPVRIGPALSVRHRVLSGRRRPAMGLCRQYRFRGPLPLSQRRSLRRAARPKSSCRICRSAATAPATSCSRRTARQCMCRSAPPRTSATAWKS